jgi:hypothetical protein
MPGIEPDQRLSLGGRTVGSRMDVDGLLGGISRSSFQYILDLAFGIDMITGRLYIKAHGAVDDGLVLASEATDG